MLLGEAQETVRQAAVHGPVLVVEDDQDIRESIADILREEGHPVEVAGNGAEALEVLRRKGAHRPCLIILDLMMPIMNGWDFRAALLKDDGLASIPIVVLSGDAHVKDKATELGCAGSVGKPISLAKLLELVERFC
jgi:CheY-like chemotaxis protein